MKKFKLILVGLALVAYSSFAFAMEKNPTEQKIKKENNTKEEKSNLIEKIKKKAENVLTKTKFEKIINLYKDIGILNESSKSFIMFNEKKNKMQKEISIKTYLKLLEEKLKYSLNFYVYNVIDFTKIKIKGYKNLILNKNNEKIVLKNSEIINIDLDGNIYITFDFTPDEEKTKTLEIFLLEKQKENEKLKKELENNELWIFYEKNEN